MENVPQDSNWYHGIDPDLLRKAGDDQPYLDRLIGVERARDRFEVVALDEDGDDMKYAAARARLQAMKDELEAFEIQHGYIDLPPDGN